MSTVLKKMFILLLVTNFFHNHLFAQTYGRLDMMHGLTSQEETQALESFEEYFSLEKAIDPADYIVGPGDELGLNILTSENLTWPLKVTPTGDLLIPSVGTIHVSGKTLKQVVEDVQQFIIEQAYPNAKVNLVLVNVRRFQIQITGAMNRPGFKTVTPINRLTDVIGKSRGFHQFAREFDITIERANGSVDKVNYLRFLVEGNLANNPTFLEGDKIIVPFGNVENEGVVIRGSISGRGYDIIEKGETLENFLRRRAKFRENTDLESVTITRNKNGREVFLNVLPKDFKTTMLKPGDSIDILRERGVMVNGFVQAPGGYAFFPGYAAADYINLAGGNTLEGNPDNVIVHHLDGTVEEGQSVVVRRGDVIVVPRTAKSVLFGDSSLLQIVAAISTIVLTYLATQ